MVESLVPEGNDRIHTDRSAHREIARGQRRDCQDSGHFEICTGVKWTHAVKSTA
jgi:hypothetical protein